jgi:hypothetical protein
MHEHGGVSLHCVGICARRRTHFLLLRQKKVSKEKATPVPRPPAGAALRCSREAGSAELALRAQTSALLYPPPAALLSSSQGGPKSQYTTARCASPWLKEYGSTRCLAQPNEPSAGDRSWGPRGRRRAAQGKTEKEVQMSEPAGQVSELPGLTEQRRAVPVLRDRRIRGRLSFGDFSLAKQRKVTRLSGRRPDAVVQARTHSNNEATP